MQDKFKASLKISPIESVSNSPISGIAGQLTVLGVPDIGQSSTPQVYIEALEIIKSRSFLYDFFNKYELIENNENIEDFYLKFLRDNLRTFKDRQTNFLTISVITNDAQKSFNILNDLKSELQEYVRSKDIQDAERNISGAINEIPNVDNVDAREAISVFIQNQVAKLLIAKNSTDYVFKVIENPVIPQKKDSPSRGALLLVFILFSLIVWFCQTMFILYVYNGIVILSFKSTPPFVSFQVNKIDFK
jgi:uncharacterized protein involved in exopolysaccharide biosynthesis